MTRVSLSKLAFSTTVAMSLLIVGLVATSAGAGGPVDTARVKYTDNYSLENSTFQTLSGTRTETGGCAFGWTRQWRNTYINPAQCSSRKVWADAQYKNSVFCFPTTVYTDYRAVTVQVTAYAESGWVNSTWATESPFSDPACPNLHFKQGFD